MAPGSVTKETTADGTRWRVRVDLGPDPVTGNRRRPQRTYKIKREADAALAAWQTEIDRGTAVANSKMSVREYMRHWLDNTARHRIRPSTYESYEQLVHSHIIPALGDLPLQKLTPTRVEAFYAAKLADNGRMDGKAGGLSRRMVRYIHAVLRMALAEAQRKDLVTRNVVDMVKPPKASRPPIATWDVSEVLTFLAGTEDDAYGAVWHVALYTGLRCGELLGLRWADVDLEAAELHVRQTVVLINNRPAFGEPKTASGKRSVAMDAATVAALREQRTRQIERRLKMGAMWQDHDLVFASEVGTPINPTNLARHFRALVAKTGVRRISLHGMRHTHATLLMLANVNPKIVSERLGHADISLTLSTYSHVMPQMQRSAADAFALALGSTHS